MLQYLPKHTDFKRKKTGVVKVKAETRSEREKNLKLFLCAKRERALNRKHIVPLLSVPLYPK